MPKLSWERASVLYLQKLPSLQISDWIEARHPLLEKRLSANGDKIVSLGISLNSDKHILIISGPNMEENLFA